MLTSRWATPLTVIQQDDEQEIRLGKGHLFAETFSCPKCQIDLLAVANLDLCDVHCANL